MRLTDDRIIHGDNLEVLPTLPDGAFQLIYLDPPFNTGRLQSRRTLATEADEAGDRTGFGGRRYTTRLLQESSYRDAFDDYLAFLAPRLVELRRVLHPTGTLYVHVDYREAHYVKLLLDELFGRECFLNEIIWAYDYGARSQAPLAGQARHDPRLRARSGRLPLRRRGGRSRAVHGAGPRDGGEGGAGQAADRRLVAHDRAHCRPREDRLPDAEARGDRAPHGARLDAARATGASTRSRAAARSARWPRRPAAATC